MIKVASLSGFSFLRAVFFSAAIVAAGSGSENNNANPLPAERYRVSFTFVCPLRLRSPIYRQSHRSPRLISQAGSNWQLVFYSSGAHEKTKPVRRADQGVLSLEWEIVFRT